ncbi:ubiquitin-like small modifier protein 1 [Methanonatronarchaeum sp. AMET-Sl]|uniref:ubiquitin-like small modifier protein 1 n=1 Tax=Methanonatronarchaeum sp. AMET-Sl TaxID=3037654 RepID=UPI00244E1C84|nr:ubiquitin-like small modifier protein 1 [Methanonatronarchaeum sp. AMET-Sl]WGI16799.1 MoaD family protein [Methanonatronarchaeum sp. AMET-Sl]
MVEIKLFANYRETAGKDKIEIQINKKTKLRQIMNQIEKQHPEIKQEIYNNQKLKKNVNILINEKTIENQEILDKEIKNTDTIALLPPVSGG